MPTKRRKNDSGYRLVRLDELLRTEVSHLSAYWTDEADFIEVRFKARDDGTVLAIAKKFGPDGGPLVCFAAGYGIIATLLALDACINGNRWRPDTPWDKKGK